MANLVWKELKAAEIPTERSSSSVICFGSSNSMTCSYLIWSKVHNNETIGLVISITWNRSQVFSWNFCCRRLPLSVWRYIICTIYNMYYILKLHLFYALYLPPFVFISQLTSCSSLSSMSCCWQWWALWN